MDLIEDGVSENHVGGKEVGELREEGAGGGRGGRRGGGGVDGNEGLETRESIGVVFRSFAVDDGHVGLKRREILGPASLAAGEVTLGEEVLERMVIGVESEGLATFQVVAENLDGVDDGEEFLFMDGVILLGGGELARLIADGLRTVTLVLKEDGAKARSGGVGVEFKNGIGSGERNSEDRILDTN